MWVDLNTLSGPTTYSRDFKKRTVDVCTDVARLDRRCFNEGTDPENKKYKNILEVWDTDGDSKITESEFTSARESMNLDGDERTSLLEIQAYLIRNIYVLCRPVRGIVSADLLEEESSELNSLYHTIRRDSIPSDIFD